MLWLTIGFLVLVFGILALVADEGGATPPADIRRVKERLKRGGYPVGGWEV